VIEESYSRAVSGASESDRAMAPQMLQDWLEKRQIRILSAAPNITLSEVLTYHGFVWAIVAFCDPNGVIDVDGEPRVLFKYIREHPELMHEAVVLFSHRVFSVFSVFKAAWPCPVPKGPPLRFSILP
jgi:hypothetical protein